jgi:hypothetical protein
MYVEDVLAGLHLERLLIALFSQSCRGCINSIHPSYMVIQDIREEVNDSRSGRYSSLEDAVVSYRPQLHTARRSALGRSTMVLERNPQARFIAACLVPIFWMICSSGLILLNKHLMKEKGATLP